MSIIDGEDEIEDISEEDIASYKLHRDAENQYRIPTKRRTVYRRVGIIHPHYDTFFSIDGTACEITGLMCKDYNKCNMCNVPIIKMNEKN